MNRLRTLAMQVPTWRLIRAGLTAFWLPLLWLPAGYVGAAESEVDLWLNKMATALHDQNYRGTFTYMHGGSFNAMQIEHKLENGKEIERMLQLNGELLEITRVDDEVICHHENSDHVDLGHRVAIGPFSGAFSENIVASREMYRFALHGEDRIAGRIAIKLAISPKHNDRYGYRLWLDKETGLLLQSQMIDVDRHRVREIFQFSNIEIGDSVGQGTFVSSLSKDTIPHRLQGSVVGRPLEVGAKPLWRASWLPNGFRPIQVPGSDQLHYSDGLATFSIFIEKSGNSNLADIVTQVGGTVVISRRIRGSQGQITVVGEVPITTARKVADSVEPVIY
jgi:sigma-E factor negative regulatory protein RseB